MAVYNFLEHFDWSRKTIHPFCTHEGSRLSGTASNIRTACSGAEVENGFAIAGTTAQNDRQAAEQAVTEWLNQK